MFVMTQIVSIIVVELEAMARGEYLRGRRLAGVRCTPNPRTCARLESTITNLIMRSYLYKRGVQRHTLADLYAGSGFSSIHAGLRS